MTRPTVGTVTEDAYARLPFYVRYDDEAGGYPLLAWLSGAMDQAAEAADIVTRSDPETSPSGTCEIANPEVAPRDWLRWLGWLVGINTSNLADAIVRDVVTNVALSQRRGSAAAMAAAIQRTLTGTKYVQIIAPAGTGTAYTYDESGEVYESSDAYDSLTYDPYAIEVRVYTSQTPDEDATLAAALSEKPAGCTLTLTQIGDGLTYAELDAAYGTYADMKATGLTYYGLSRLTS